MRVIFESDNDEDFLELILSENEIETLRDYKGIQKNCMNLIGERRNLNLFVRRGSHAIEKG